MLSKCANPACTSAFRYLHEGKVFRLERRHDDDPELVAKDFEYFWLCSSCAGYLTVVCENGGIRVQPLHLPVQSSGSRLAPVLLRRTA